VAAAAQADRNLVEKVIKTIIETLYQVRDPSLRVS
jgi:hypothetical protein